MIKERFESVEDGAYRMGWVIGNAALGESQKGHVTFTEAILPEAIDLIHEVPLSMSDVLAAPKHFNKGLNAAKEAKWGVEDE